MRLEITEECVDFYRESLLAGRYGYRDPFKPYIHPLNSPQGWALSLRSPHDHLHHKGLMYALRAADLNFWEEHATTAQEKVGRQRHDRFGAVISGGNEIGFHEQLTWIGEDGTLETFVEHRAISCRFNDTGHTCFQWEWSTELIARRDVTLTLSQWSVKNDQGRPINYHGLGLRLRRDFGCTGGNQLLLDGAAVPFNRALGLTPREAVFIGSLDDTRPIRKAGVKICPSDSHGLFVLESPFAFISFGPTVLGTLRLKDGDHLKDSYLISVFDGEPVENIPAAHSDFA
jgi:hypothetical protein